MANGEVDSRDPQSVEEACSTNSDKPVGSSIFGAAANLFNVTTGAGVIGLGSAIAGSGGLISATMIVVFAIMTKMSLDMVISLAVETGSTNFSYEDLAMAAYGTYGSAAVMLFKWIFSFGCLVAYIVIVKDNCSSALKHLLGVEERDQDQLSIFWNDNMMTIILSTTVMLPLSLLREIGLLVHASTLKIFAIFLTALILVFLYFDVDETKDQMLQAQKSDHDLLFDHWYAIKSTICSNLGTFVFLYISQHACNLVFQSIRPELRNVKGWKQVTRISTAMFTLLVFMIGFFSYMTFWEKTDSNIFQQYPQSPAVDVARLLLCITVLLTYPPPFFTCRELIIRALPRHGRNEQGRAATVLADELTLLLQYGSVASTNGVNPHLQKRCPDQLEHDAYTSTVFLPGGTLQLAQPYHTILTILLWASTLILALHAPSLGDVLNLAGSISGTMIGFVLPGLFYIKIHGYSRVAYILLVLGTTFGCIGTYFSFMHILYLDAT